MIKKNDVGAQLASQRKTHIINCNLCGVKFTGLIKKITCTKCLNRLRAQKFRSKNKEILN